MQETTQYAINTSKQVGNMFMEPLMALLPQAVDIGVKILAALLVLLIGNLIVGIIMKVLNKGLDIANLDGVLAKVGVTKELENAGVSFSARGVLSGVIRLILKLVVWMAVINVLGIQQLTDFMNQILYYMPNIIVALLILGIGMTVAKKAEEIIANVADNKLAKNEAGLLARVAKYAILTITIMAALVQLQIGGALIETLFAGIVAMLAIAGGIAFGLGGKDRAKEIVDKVAK